MNRTPTRSLALLVAGWLAAVAVAPAEDLASPVVTIRLEPRAVVTTRTVRFGDVAQLAGGPAALREQIGRLDLADVPRDATVASPLSISRRQAEYRLKLAGLPAPLYRVEGAPAAEVTLRGRTVKAEEVVAEARAALLAKLPWAGDEVQVDLVQPVLAALPQVATDEELVIKAVPRAGQRPPGRVQMDVNIFVQGESRLSLSVYFNVRVCQVVLVARSRIDPGEPLTALNTYAERQAMDGGGKLTLRTDGVTTYKARRALQPGQVVLEADVLAPVVAAEEILVRVQEAVKMRVRVSDVQVLAGGVAMQEGRRGQLIRVQNIESKKVVIGRVTDRGLVEVE